MGCTFGYSSKDDTLRSILADGQFVNHTLVGSEFWTVLKAQDGTNVIVLFLLAKENGSYGYKVIDEGMHPYYYKCPLSFLKLAPVASEEWRKGVHAYHESKRNVRRERDQAKRDLGLVRAPGGAFGGWE
jgi:hypothetical protein